MPITQQRMLDLISAASDYERGLTAAVGIVSDYWRRANAGSISWQEALTMVDASIRHTSLLTHPLDSTRIIALERAHFSSTAQRANAKAKEKMTRQRRARGVMSRQQPGTGIGKASSPALIDYSLYEDPDGQDISAPSFAGLSPEDKAQIDQELVGFASEDEV